MIRWLLIYLLIFINIFYKIKSKFRRGKLMATSNGLWTGLKMKAEFPGCPLGGFAFRWGFKGIRDPPADQGRKWNCWKLMKIEKWMNLEDERRFDEGEEWSWNRWWRLSFFHSNILGGFCFCIGQYEADMTILQIKKAGKAISKTKWRNATDTDQPS